MPPNTLADIQAKVRKLTRSPSTAQLSVVDLNNYINTFVVYDFPEHLRTFLTRQPFTFYCNAYQDVYPTGTMFGGLNLSVDYELYDFQNLYLTVHPPVYIAGYPTFYTQSRDQFYGIYPQTNSIFMIGAGDGAKENFFGNIQQIFNNQGLGNMTPLLPGEVNFTAVDANGNTMNLFDAPNYNIDTCFAGTGALIIANSGGNPAGVINYITGAYNITFPAPPAAGTPINIECLPYVAQRPLALLYYNNTFTVRPIPDKGYPIQIEVYKSPTSLLAQNSTPELNEWWQYIAYGAAKKVFEDRMDLESVQLILPEYRKQENLCNRRSIVQYTNERVATIYTESTGNGGFGNGGNGWTGW